MKSAILFSVLVLVIGSLGCDGDGDGDGAAAAVPEPPSGTDDDSSSDDDSAPEPETLLKSDTGGVGAGLVTLTGSVTAPAAGTFRSILTWSGEPDQLTSHFEEEGDSTALGWAQGPSGFEGTTSVDAGTNYSFYISNSSGHDAIVTYAIYFTPD